MGAKYQAYPEYKDSGVEWLGDVPTHWFSTKIKYGYDITLGKMLQKEAKSSEDRLRPYLKAVNIQSHGVSLEQVGKMWFSPSDLRSLKLIDGDVLISEGGDVGRSAIWRNELPDCYIQNAINRARPKMNRSSRFLFYWLNMLKSSEYIDILCNKATIAHYTAEKVENSPLYIPSDEEAEKIANFLDHETAKIDTLIEKQQQLIKLLKEKRQAVISHAVTKGLNPNAPMRDSGVEWLGEVPEHWAVGRYKFCTSRVVVGIAEAATHAYAEVGVPIIRSTNIREEGLDTSGMLYIKKEFAEKNDSKYLYANDVITVRTGYPGTSAVIPDELNKSQCFTNLVSTPMKNILPAFLSEYLNSHTGKSYFDLLGWGSAQKNISVPILQNVPIAWPDECEQSEIMSYVQSQRGRYTNLVGKAGEQITLLQERRTALISAAVTGKIDVRNWQAPEPSDNQNKEVAA